MTVAPYITAPGDVAAIAWWPLGSRVVALLRDGATGLAARLTYQGALDAAEALDGSLASRDDVVELQAEGLALQPVTLPDAHLCAEAGVPFDWDRHADQIEAFLTTNMGGLAWAEYHDARVAEQLAALGWDEHQAIAGWGKHWISGAPAGRAYLMGWWNGKRWIQPPSPLGSQGPHDRGHHDYGTTTLVVRAAAP